MSMFSSPLRSVHQFLGDRLYKSSAIAEMGDRLATIGMGRKWRVAAVGAGSPSNSVAWA